MGDGNGRGAAIKAVTPGGQADGHINVGQVISHINGTDITNMKVREIAPLIKSSTTIVLRFKMNLSAEDDDMDGIDDNLFDGDANSPGGITNDGTFNLTGIPKPRESVTDPSLRFSNAQTSEEETHLFKVFQSLN